MSNVKWLFERDTFEEGLQALLYTCDSLKIDYKVYDYRPFNTNESSGGLRSLFNEDDCVVVYGSIQLCSAVDRWCSWIPGTYCTFDNYLCTSYYPRLYKYLLNDNYVMLPYGDLIHRKSFLYSTLGEDNCLFIRPNSGRKLFTGKLVEKENFEREVDKFGFYDTMPSDLVVVASPQNILKEWRLLIVAQKVVTASEYRPDHKRDCPQEVLDLGNEVAKLYEPDKCWTLDICQTKSGDLRVLEIGSFSCAGMYACNPVSVISEVSSQAFLDWQEVNT